MAVGIAEMLRDQGQSLFRLGNNVRTQFMGGPDQARANVHPYHGSFPVNRTTLPAFLSAWISFSARSSAASASAKVAPYSSRAGKVEGRNGSAPSLTSCAKNKDTAWVGLRPKSSHTRSACSTRSRLIR